MAANGLRACRAPLAAAIVLLAALASAAEPARTKLHVLHVNDIHARYDPNDVNASPECAGDLNATCFGGMARVTTAVLEGRAVAEAEGADSLFLHAGDQFTGTNWDVVYTSQGDMALMTFLAEAGVQAFTLGNHEFDYGPMVAAEFAANVTALGIPVLSCNLDASKVPALDAAVQDFTIIELPLSKKKVGVVGLTSNETSATSQPGPLLTFRRYDETLPGCVAAARAAGAEVIIALTHIGYQDDVALAASAAAAGVDLIVGGHSHTLLYGEPALAGQPQVAAPSPQILVSPPTNESTQALGPYPTLVLAADGRTLPVVQAYWASRYFGVLNTTWGPEGLVSAAGAVRLLGGANSTDEVPEDAAVSQNLDAMRGPLEAMDEEGVGAAAVLLNGARADVRSKETNLADLICDAMFRYIDASTGLLAAAPDAPVICLLNGGGIRASIAAGNVSYGDIINVLPFGNFLVAKEVNASTLVEALNSGLAGWTGDDSGEGRFPQVGNLTYGFDPTLPADARLVSAQLSVPGAGGASSWVPLEGYEGEIVLLTNDYVAKGGDYYTMFADAPVLLDSDMLLAQALSTYFTEFSPIDVAVDGRIVNCNATSGSPLCAAAAAPPPAPPASAAAAAGVHGWVLWVAGLAAVVAALA